MAKRFLGWLGSHLQYLVLAAPFLLCLLFIHAYGVNLAWWDQLFGMVPIFDKWQTGKLTLWDFWAQHHEHRIVFPRLVMFGLGLLSGWNTIVEMYVVALLLLVAVMGWSWVFLREVTGRHRAWLLLPAVFLGFSLRQSENLLWGFQITFAMVVAGAVITLLCLYRANGGRRVFWFVSAIVMGTVTSFSCAHGLAVWPAGLVALLLLSLGRRVKITLLTSWTVMGVVVWAVYFYHFVKPPYHPAFSFSGWYGLTMLGGALFSEVRMALVAGLILTVFIVVATVLVIRDPVRHRHSFWLGLITFSIVVIAITCVGRSKMGDTYALQSRYATCTLLAVVGIYGILSSMRRDGASGLLPGALGMLIGLMVLGVCVSGLQAREAAAQQREGLLYQAFVYCTVDTQPDWEISVSAQTVHGREYVEKLRRAGLNVFASPQICSAYDLPDPDLPVLATEPQHELSVRYDEKTKCMSVSGWAVDSSTGRPAGGVCIEVDGHVYRAYYGIRVPNPSDVLLRKGLTRTGFLRTIPYSQLSEGRHQLILRVLTNDGQAVLRPPKPVEVAIWH